MPATLHPVQPELLASLRSGDERAFERLFRQEYSALVEMAGTELEDPTAAPRIAEASLLNAWEHRAEFGAPDELAAFLEETVHHGAVREKARHAMLHHHAGVAPAAAAHAPRTSGPADVEGAWRHATAVLHPDSDAVEREAHLRADLSRHVAAEHVAHVAEKRSWRFPIIVGAVSLLVLAPALLWLDRASADASASSALASKDARVVNAPAGKRAQVTLRDGSAVSLAPATDLRIPPGFGTDWRVVAVEGSAQIATAAGKPQPLEIRVGAARVMTGDGSLLVRHYDDDATTFVRLTSGHARVLAGRTTRELVPGTTVAISSDSVITAPPGDAASDALAWSSGQVVLRGVPLRQAIRAMSRWYGTDLSVTDESLLDRTVSIVAPLDSPRAAITSLEQTGQLAFGYAGREMVLRDAAPARKR